MSVLVLCRSTTVGVAFSSIAPFQHTACLLKDIYSPATLHMRMTRSIVPRGIEMSDSDDCFSITAGNLPSLSLSDTSLSDRRSMWTVSDNFLRYGELTITVIRVGHLSTSHTHVQCASIRKSSRCTVQCTHTIKLYG